MPEEPNPYQDKSYLESSQKIVSRHVRGLCDELHELNAWLPGEKATVVSLDYPSGPEVYREAGVKIGDVVTITEVWSNHAPGIVEYHDAIWFSVDEYEASFRSINLFFHLQGK